MADDKKEKKSIKDMLSGLSIGNLFGGRPWIIFAIMGVILVVIVILVVMVVSRGNRNKSISVVNPGMLTAAIVVGDDRYAAHDETGALVGVEPDLAASLAEAEGLTIKLIEASTVNEALSYVDTGAADVAFGRISADRNLNGYAVSSEYSRCGLFMVTALHDYTDSLDLMTGYSVGVMDTVQLTSQGIRGYEYISPRPYTDAVKMGEDIRDRAVNMGICNEREAISLVRAFPNALQTQEITGGTMERYVAVFPGRQAGQAAIMNAVIAEAN
ncbi:MAG: transporter substrate-binding domain-containing protein [Lachnospiraceae bacterium]|nr:transporter substrate-binding domain-containing protein [Lachnospiraceae bacterium]